MVSPAFVLLMSRSSVAGPVAEERVREAEATLSVKFPPEYRTFVRSYGAVMGRGFDIAGLFVEDRLSPPLWRDVVKATRAFRRSVDGNLPEALIPIAEDGQGVTFCIDTRVQEEGGSGVVAYGPGVDGVTVADSVEEFVVKLSRA